MIFKGLLQWLFDMIINITEYLANSLLTIFSMDLDYFETAIPITNDVFNIILCVGWALLLGNFMFQAMKSMLSGLGFEGEDPRMLFGRTVVMMFLLVGSRQICDIGLGMTKKVIDWLQVPETVQVPRFIDSMFSIPGDASWLLAIIIGIVMVVQIVKLFFEIGERYVIVAILTILSPLAFAMGGSKSTADVFKGWVRMFAIMCLMMVLSVIFLKFVLSAMSVVPTGAAVVPWCIFIVAIARTGRKIDEIITRIGLNPAITGDPLGRSRMPGMLSHMVVKNIAGNIGKSAEAAKSGTSKPETARPALSSGAVSVRPPIGSGAGKETAEATPSISGGHPSPGAGKTTGTPPHKDASSAISPAFGRDMTGFGSIPAASIRSGEKPGKPGTGSSAATSATTAKPSPPSGVRGTGTPEKPAGISPAAGKTHSSSDDKRVSRAEERAMASSSALTKSHSASTPKAATPIAARPTADVSGSAAPATKPCMPTTHKTPSAISSADNAADTSTAKGTSSETSKVFSSVSEAEAVLRPTRPATVMSSAPAISSALPSSKTTRLPEAATKKPMDSHPKDERSAQSLASTENTAFSQKSSLSKPESSDAKKTASRPPMMKTPDTSIADRISGTMRKQSEKSSSSTYLGSNKPSEPLHKSGGTTTPARPTISSGAVNNTTPPPKTNNQKLALTGVGSATKASSPSKPPHKPQIDRKKRGDNARER